MRLAILGLALGMSCLAVSACGPKRVAVPIPIPAERMDCVTISDQRPVVPAEYVIDWTKVLTVDQARAEHQAFVTRLRQREQPISGYIVALEGQLFACSNDAAWLQDYQKRLPDPG